MARNIMGKHRKTALLVAMMAIGGAAAVFGYFGAFPRYQDDAQVTLGRNL